MHDPHLLVVRRVSRRELRVRSGPCRVSRREPGPCPVSIHDKRLQFNCLTSVPPPMRRVVPRRRPPHSPPMAQVFPSSLAMKPSPPAPRGPGRGGRRRTRCIGRLEAATGRVRRGRQCRGAVEPRQGHVGRGGPWPPNAAHRARHPPDGHRLFRGLCQGRLRAFVGIGRRLHRHSELIAAIE